MMSQRPPRPDRCGVPATAVLLAVLLAVLAPRQSVAAGGASCSLAATPLVFGNYESFSSQPADFTATVTVTCTTSGPAPVPLQASIGVIGRGGPFHRRLTDGVHALRYQLFLDPARTTPLGDGRGGGEVVSMSGAVSANAPFRQDFVLYGRILARQSAATIGHYVDRITAILTY
jgi:spore coat protein U domain-containing protein, fimbrial subunit CupE1/2/3/6